MKDYIYKCVPMPSKLEVTKHGNVTSTAAAYEEIINEAVYDGWEFVTSIVTNTLSHGGTVNKMLGVHGEVMESNMLVFKKRDKEEPVTAKQENKPTLDGANLLSELNGHKLEIIEQLKIMNAHLGKLNGK